MAYSALTFTASEVPTLTKWNQLWANDASFNDGTGISTNAITAAKIAAGAVTTLKQTASGCALVVGTSVSVANSALVPLTFSNEDFDTDGYHSTVSNTSRITIPAGMAGKYLFRAGINWGSNGSGLRFMFFCKNGVTTERRGLVGGPPHSGDTTGQNISYEFDLVAGDYIEAYVFQSSGGALNALGDSANVGGTSFQCFRLGA